MEKFEVQEKSLTLEKMRRDFVANVSHELRTPLTVIHGYLESLIDHSGFKDIALKKIFAEMYKQTTRMENIIEDLLLLSRLESGQNRPTEHKQVNMAKLIKVIYKEAVILSGESNHKFHLAIDTKLHILGDEKELGSMISNIVLNAVKYTPSNRDIFIEWCRDSNYACLKVRDTGIGIAKKHISRLTERFYRVDKARSRASGGTGLGLAIVKHVLNRHNAKLEVESRVGEGSVFLCLFPLGDCNDKKSSE